MSENKHSPLFDISVGTAGLILTTIVWLELLELLHYWRLL
jgi:hypothetical protein